MFLDKENQRIKFNRRREKESTNFQNIEKIAAAFSKYEPISLEAVFNGGGNARSAIEAIIARLPQVGFMKAKSHLNPGSKRLVWLSSEKNTLNSIYHVNELDLQELIPFKNVSADVQEKNKTLNSATAHDLKLLHSEFNKEIESINLKISSIDTIRALTAVLTKPVVSLTGLSGSGKPKRAEAMAYWLSADADKQVCIVAVGADWTNNEPLLGYADAINVNQKRYCAPASGILQLLQHAVDNENKPHFLILDEMNLSHVERYFADFLSAMESSKPKLAFHGQGLLNAVGM